MHLRKLILFVSMCGFASENILGRQFPLYAGFLNVENTLKLGQTTSNKLLQKKIKNDIGVLVTESYGDVGIFKKKSNKDFVVFDAERNLIPPIYWNEFAMHEFVDKLFSVPQENESLDDYQFYGTFECTYFFARNRLTNKISIYRISKSIVFQEPIRYRELISFLESVNLNDYNVMYMVFSGGDQNFLLQHKRSKFDVRFFSDGKRYLLEDLSESDKKLYEEVAVGRVLIKPILEKVRMSKALIPEDYLECTERAQRYLQFSIQLLKMFVDNGMEINNEICDCRAGEFGDEMEPRNAQFRSYAKWLMYAQQKNKETAKK